MLNIQFRIHYTMLVVVYADLGQTLETHDELQMWDHKNSLVITSVLLLILLLLLLVQSG